ncbi:hypothetical protein BDV59DRAFT_85797 [Aspergillus ambiguus]|uniref:homeobox domain-containing protein n=1 Tax=Aspergillus ambiguus TaxID=176160 RepID=UPI003CCE0BCF
MSDPEPSVAACSSSPPTVQASDPAAAAAALNYAFLVHSQKTLTQNLPPRVDNKLLARQKRRRTSPEDHAILEAEYQRNPKPDKTARADIVSRVSLGEKEVQIWFQNRRQNDRRKSKPLQPHELLALRSSTSSEGVRPSVGDDSLSAEPESSIGAEQYEGNSQDTNPPGDGSFESEGGQEDKNGLGQLCSQSSTVSTEAVASSQPGPDEVGPEPAAVQDDEAILEEPQGSAKRKRSGSDVREPQTALPQASTTPGGVQSLKSPPSLRISLSFDGEAMVRKEGELTPSPPKGRNALRIAMSSDGKAVIRAEGEPSPSKNRISMFTTRKSRLGGLRRSNSAVVLGTPRGSIDKERLFGRSRDPRNWEAFFDTDARSALSTPTSSQSNPHAGTPALFRSSSQRSLTRSLSARHSTALAPASNEYMNTPVPQPSREKRRKISRTVSSLGRLESSLNAVNKPLPMSKTPKTPAHGAKDDLDGGDSDKENWIPGTRVTHARRRPTAHQQFQRSVLRESNGRDGRLTKGLSGAGKQSRKASGGNSKTAPPVDAEVSAFMSGGGSASQEEDLDCIQGLLSLSQGAWR